LRVPADALAAAPPGRGLLGNDEVQLAVLGGSTLVTDQARAVEHLAERLRRQGRPEMAPVPRLEARRLAELPTQFEGRPVIGMSGETMGPLAIEPRGSFVVAGPPGSGVRDALVTIVRALRRWRPGHRVAYLGSSRSPLAGVDVWFVKATTPADVDALAEQIARELPAAAPGEWTVVIEDLPTLAPTSTFGLDRLVKAVVSADHFLVASGDADAMGSWGDAQIAARANRTGIVLQPDATHGDSIFKTPFPRLARTEFPAGRGLYVSGGMVTRVQMADVD
jgi:S-DNA-T family DNA segregation ATPase FtsK/SpoIIIE